MVWALRSIGVAVSVAAMLGAALLSVATASRLHARPRTDDAFLETDLVHLAPDVSGRIVGIEARNNYAVHRDQLLFLVDPEPYQLRVDQAAAQVRGLEAQLAVETNQVASQGSKASAAQTGIGSARAQLALATATRDRLEPLGAQGYVPAEQVDQARTAQLQARISLLEAQEKAQQAREAVSNTQPLQAQLDGARASLALAERDLRLTRVRSPCDGVITGLDVAVGEYVAQGRPVFTIIDTEHWYAVGNFRETILPGLKIGQRATVYVLSQPGAPIRGTVESVSGGVAPDEDESTGGLPRVPRSLEWVRIAQRFPVRVLLDDPPADLMKVGASADMVLER